MKREYDFSQAKRGSVVPASRGKTRITIRLDDEILGWFKQQAHQLGGASYQSLINEALHDHVRAQREPLETIVRRVVREELSRSRHSRQRKSAA